MSVLSEHCIVFYFSVFGVKSFYAKNLAKTLYPMLF